MVSKRLSFELRDRITYAYVSENPRADVIRREVSFMHVPIAGLMAVLH